MSARMRNVRWVSRGGDWRIESGVSRFLVAEGAGWSRRVGRELFHRLKWGIELRTKDKPVNNCQRPEGSK